MGLFVFSKMVAESAAQLAVAVNLVFMPRLAQTYGRTGTLTPCLKQSLTPTLITLGTAVPITLLVWFLLPKPVIIYAFPIVSGSPYSGAFAIWCSKQSVWGSSGSYVSANGINQSLRAILIPKLPPASFVGVLECCWGSPVIACTGRVQPRRRSLLGAPPLLGRVVFRFWSVTEASLLWKAQERGNSDSCVPRRLLQLKTYSSRGSLTTEFCMSSGCGGICVRGLTITLNAFAISV